MVRKKAPAKAKETLTERDVPAWMQHGIILNCIEGQPIQLLMHGMTPDVALNVLIDALGAVRKMESEYTHGVIRNAYRNGAIAESQRMAKEEGDDERDAA